MFIHILSPTCLTLIGCLETFVIRLVSVYMLIVLIHFCPKMAMIIIDTYIETGSILIGEVKDYYVDGLSLLSITITVLDLLLIIWAFKSIGRRRCNFN